jgi:hypothetical protein
MSSLPSFFFFPTRASKNPHHESKKTMESMTPAINPMPTAAIPITFHSVASAGGMLGASFGTPIVIVGEGKVVDEELGVVVLN